MGKVGKFHGFHAAFAPGHHGSQVCRLRGIRDDDPSELGCLDAGNHPGAWK